MTIIIAFAVIFAFCFFVYRNRDKWKENDGGGDSDPEADLLQRCRSDRAQMNRLIAHEMKSAPEISRPEAASRAVHAFKRDNR